MGIVCTLLVGASVWLLWPTSKATLAIQPKQQLGLMTSLPIYWGENADLAGMLNSDQPSHWVRAQLEHKFELVPIDALAGVDSAEPSDVLAELKLLLLAQPAALPPADLVALDNWVRAGGRLLMFADPMLTEHSEFGFGDKRRPQDIAMLSPILKRWGLEQIYDPDQDKALRTVQMRGHALPVRRAGRLRALAEQKEARALCRFLADAIVADCQIGSGRVLIVSDAAVLDHEINTQAAGKALDELLKRVFKAPE